MNLYTHTKKTINLKNKMFTHTANKWHAVMSKKVKQLVNSHILKHQILFHTSTFHVVKWMVSGIFSLHPLEDASTTNTYSTTKTYMRLLVPASTILSHTLKKKKKKQKNSFVGHCGNLANWYMFNSLPFHYE